ncbi:hypothetical protein [Leuconostoc citreum]|uniref:hypothetical protein n=1 Tax=Leuconostoc citreum TaxID=33964 RepID=UPI0020A12D0D|nr:hypothetical protein [Leuconostoc citreum]MCP1276617.1 hypothetical protein [Leuconostoc citreum]
MTVSNALFNETSIIKDTNSAFGDVEDTLAHSLVNGLTVREHFDVSLRMLIIGKSSDLLQVINMTKL